MPVYRNAKFTGRDYECTNIVAAEAPDLQTLRAASPHGDWRPARRDMLERLTALWRQGDVRFYGYL